MLSIVIYFQGFLKKLDFVINFWYIKVVYLLEVNVKSASFILSILLVVSLGNAETHISGGNISGVWELAGSPFYIEGNCVITSTSTLEIEPGVQVLMEPLVRIRCEGQLLAVGTETDSILFTATDTTQGCEGLDFLNTDSSPMDSSKLAYCIIKHGVGSPYPDMYMHGGGLYLKNSSRVLLSHSLIAYCRTRNVFGVNGTIGSPGTPGESVESGHGGAIYCTNSSPAIINNEICYNRTGDAYGGEGGNGTYGFETLDSASGGDGGEGGTALSGLGGGIFLEGSHAVVYGNVIHNNHCGDAFGGNGGNGGGAESWSSGAYGGDGEEGAPGLSGFGGAVYSVASTTALVNNLLYQNKTGDGYGGAGGNGGDALGFGGTSSPGIGAPGGVGQGGDGYSICGAGNSNISFINCTITAHEQISQGIGGAGGQNGNQGSYAAHGIGIDGEGVVFGYNIAVVHSIIWNNVDPTVTLIQSMTYTCIEGGYTGTGNIDQDPIFVSASQGDYFLSQTAAGQLEQSPCVDTGNPATPLISGTTRTDGEPDDGILDLGYHYNSTLSASLLSVFPGGLNFYVEYGYTNPEDQILVIYNDGLGTFNYNVSESIDWLTVTPMSGGPVPPSDTLVVSVDTTGLGVGIHEGEITIIAEGAMGSPKEIPVALSITQSGPLSGPISGVLPQAVYEVDGDIYVDTDNYLEIEPGVVLLFNGLYSFDIYGYLHAVGTESDSIKFITNEGIEGWKGLRFWDSAADSCSLEYSVIAESDSSAIYCDNVSLVIKHCTIRDNYGFHGGGVWCNNSPVIIDSCTVSCNSAWQYGGGIYLYLSDSAEVSNCTISENFANNKGAGINIYGSNCIVRDCIVNNNTCENNGAGIGITWNEPLISNCTITDNVANGFGGGIHSHQYSEPVITDCIISRNSAQWGGGLLISHPGTDLEVGYCEISDNSAANRGGGIYISSGGGYDIHHNLISGNTASERGGGMCIQNSGSPGVRNNTIVNNTAPDGGGMYLSDNNYWGYEGKFITSNIIEDNTGGGGYYGEEGESLIKYCDIFNNDGGNLVGLNIPAGLGELTNVNLNGDSCDFCNNIFVDPLFVDPFNGNFNLQQNSLCIDAGDPVCPDDPDGTIPDIGAFYFEQDMPSASVCLIPDESYLTIPATGGEFDFNIAITNNEATSLSFDVWIVAQLPNGTWFGPLLGPVNITLSASQTVNRDRIQTVPAAAPFGNYEYSGRVGIHPDDIWHADSFTFVKWESGDGGPVNDWFNSGESFDQWLTLTTQPQIPDHFALYPAFPNPFNPATTICYALPQAAKVNLTVYNVSGRSVANLINGWRDAGVHEVTFNTLGASGLRLSSGIYIYRLTAGEFSASVKMVLMK
ncbi:hypothetical protein CEE37_00950 [candidate division LCP-89 bacterium B3_LCP]|uniref:Right handed beta helix domain-containing protein n=1 Tax=candidate division LCP-89 bacterium B3_LCP TaxID=2012998 RepID=A0A532V5N0_UNCL8|nr:MAG: hypothetical protein CEE37_00950 [candidate division LCP-89 bacterium B3_LCP]